MKFGTYCPLISVTCKSLHKSMSLQWLQVLQTTSVRTTVWQGSFQTASSSNSLTPINRSMLEFNLSTSFSVEALSERTLQIDLTKSSAGKCTCDFDPNFDDFLCPRVAGCVLFIFSVILLIQK